MEEDYYKLLKLNYNSSLNDINKACKSELAQFKLLPFLNEHDEKKIKQIKKAQYIFNNIEYKEIYDQNILKKTDKKKNSLINHNDYLINRIFDIKINNNSFASNLNNNEFLRPKNTGLNSDMDIDYDDTDLKTFNS
jgi:curved DNA-binding protein CbpA